MTKIRLQCILKGDSSLITVDIAPDDQVTDLKELVHSKATNSLKDIDAKDLVLWKVRHPHGPHLAYTDSSRQPRVQIAVQPELQCSERVQRLNLPDEAHRLDGATLVAAVFPELVPAHVLTDLKKRERRPLRIPPEYLHIIVQKPDTGEYCFLFMSLHLPLHYFNGPSFPLVPPFPLIPFVSFP